jgi:riboflavin kinase/FMN adenylyltransferase
MISITGKVVHGDAYGRVLGFPTANIDKRSFAKKKFQVKAGVYAGTVLLNSKRYIAAITVCPKEHQSSPKIEAHLIGFSRNLYGKKITIIFGKFLRGWIHFKNELALKKQIAKDVEKIKLY